MVFRRGVVPYALAAVLIGLVGGFSSVLGPAFVADMGLDYSDTTWTALAQAMSTAACAPVLGRVGDLIGRIRTLLLGIGVFTLGNLSSALAGSLWAMLISRFVVGIGTAAVGPVILAYIATQLPPDQTAKGFAGYMLLSSASVILGPTLGGLITSAYGWRALVWVCVAVCVVVLGAAVITSRKEQEQRRPPQPFDVPGSLLSLLFFSLLLCVPALGQSFGWRSWPFLGALGAAAVSLVGLVLAERRADRPVIPGWFVGRRAFLLSVLALFLTQGLMQANMTDIIVFVEYTRPQDTVVSGYAISVMYVGMSLGAVLLGPLADRYEPKKLLLGSFLLTGVGCGLLLLFREVTPVYLLMASLGALGFGLGGNGTVFMKVVLSGLCAGEAGAGTGTYGLFRDLAAPFGVAVFVPLFTEQITVRMAAGAEGAAAAVEAVRFLGAVELGCVALGMVAVACLPGRRIGKER